MNKKVLNAAQLRAYFNSYSLSIALAGIALGSADGCSGKKGGDENPNQNQNNPTNSNQPGSGSNSENPQQDLEGIASKKDLKEIKDALDAIVKFDATKYDDKTAIANELKKYATTDALAKKADLGNYLTFDDKGNVSFKYKVGSVENEVKIVENGVLKSTNGTVLGITELQELLNKCDGATANTPVLNFNEKTTFNGKKISTIVDEILASVTTEYGYNNGTADTKGSLKAVIEAVVKAMIGAGATAGSHEANLHANTRVNGVDIVTGNFIDLLVAELNSDKYNNTGGDIAKQTASGVQKLRELLAAGAINNTALQNLFTAATGGVGAKEFTLDNATKFGYTPAGGFVTTGTFTDAATAIVNAIIGNLATKFGTDSTKSGLPGPSTIDDIATAIADLRVKALMGDSAAAAGTLAAKLHEDTLFGYNLSGVTKNATFKDGVDELADLRVKALMGDGAAAAGTLAAKLHAGTEVNGLKANTGVVDAADDKISSVIKNLQDRLAASEAQNEAILKLQNKIDRTILATSESKYDVVTLLAEIKRICTGDAANIATAINNIGDGNFIGYCEAAADISAQDDSRNAINSIYNNTHADKVFIYKNTANNSIGIYKITVQLNNGNTDGRCVILKNDGYWDGTDIQLGA